MKTVLIDTNRACYELAQCTNTLKVRDLIETLEDLDPEAPVVFRNDGGYTYGAIEVDDITCVDVA